MRALHDELVRRGHDVTRTPNEWMPLDASDETQLLRAAARGRAVFTFNARDFQALARCYPRHAGIVLAAQTKWTLSNLIAALDQFLSEVQAEDLVGQVRWLSRRAHTETNKSVGCCR